MNTTIQTAKSRFSRFATSVGLIAAGALFFAGLASAHVTVKPSVSQPNAWETYTLKVPVEKNIPTTKVALKIPKEVVFKQYEPVPNWKVATEKDSSGKVTTVTWTTEKDGIQAGQYQRFSFVAQNADQNTAAAWDAFQYYSDGSIVEWTGDEGSNNPHSITEITAEATSATPAADSGHDSAGMAAGHASTDTTKDSSSPAPASNNAVEAAPAASAPASSTAQTTALVLSIIAVVLGAAAVGIALKRRK
ncbi:YcnI family copper-binding membrane protein [Paenibacillus peoriae]|uniref:YcnI family copper-binding membrane protein n=1 Tax=Paenibacillus peoriae TaxID=59893 RepID=UPI00096C9834|nr:YcnI family protein [Paenibacillus peoriae]OMF32062.1 nuclear export factor gle1 [Paenibacillus peoriae]